MNAKSNPPAEADAGLGRGARPEWRRLGTELAGRVLERVRRRVE